MRLRIFSCVIFIICACTSKPKTESGFVNAGKLKVYYETYGTGDAVLFLHAGLQDHLMWNSQVKALEDDFKVILVDLPGQGKTSGNDTIILIADVLIKVLDHLNIQKASVVGLSYGSTSAADLVMTYPDRIDKVVLVSPGITGWEKILKPDSLSNQYFALLDTAYAKKNDSTTAKIFTEVWCDGLRKPEEVKKEVRDYIYHTTYENLTQHDNDSWGNFSKTRTGADAAKGINNPVMVIYGDKDLPLITAVAHYYDAVIPNSKAVQMKGVAHMLNMEKPEAFNQLLIDFLKE
jgi:3-oxoadipate enol-lactonase